MFTDNTLESSPLADPFPPCEKCLLIDCHFVHDYQASDCILENCSACPDLVEIDAKISNAQDILADLIRKRQSIKTRINRQHDCLTTHFPIEIISTIFNFFGESGDQFYAPKDGDFFPEEHVWFPPLLLGAVCKKWRVITLKTPHLWASLKFNLRKELKTMALTKKILARSGALPLSLNIRSEDAYDDDVPNPLHPVLKALRSLSGRWKHVHLDALSASEFHALFNNLTNIPSLDYLYVELVDGASSPVASLPTYLRQPMAVTKVDIRKSLISGMPFQWDQLTHLNMDGIPLQELWLIISYAENLAHCVANVDGRLEDPVPVLFRPSLTHIETNTSRKGQNILDCLSLPSLKTLKYRLHGAYSEDSKPLVEYRRYLKRLSSVTRLELDVCCENSATGVHDLFLFLKSSVKILPNLRELRICSNEFEREAWNSLASFLESGHLASRYLSNDSDDSSASSASVPEDARPLKRIYIQQERTYSSKRFPSRKTLDALCDVKRSARLRLDILNLAQRGDFFSLSAKSLTDSDSDSDDDRSDSSTSS